MDKENKDMALPSDRAVAADAVEPVPVSPLRASIPSAVQCLQAELDELRRIIGTELGASRVSVFAADLDEVLKAYERSENAILNMQVFALTEGDLR